jgi:hypothetical protein
MRAIEGMAKAARMAITPTAEINSTRVKPNGRREARP